MINLSLTIGIITNIVILLLISNGDGFEPRTCCEKGKLLQHRMTMTCSNGDMSISCGGGLARYKEKEFFNEFEIVNNNGTEFLKNYTTGYIIPSDK